MYVAGCRSCSMLPRITKFWCRMRRPCLRINLDGTKGTFCRGSRGSRRARHLYQQRRNVGSEPDARPADEDDISQFVADDRAVQTVKFLAEQAVRDMTSKGLPAVIVNPSILPVGPWRHQANTNRPDDRRRGLRAPSCVRGYRRQHHCMSTMSRLVMCWPLRRTHRRGGTFWAATICHSTDAGRDCRVQQDRAPRTAVASRRRSADRLRRGGLGDSWGVSRPSPWTGSYGAQARSHFRPPRPGNELGYQPRPARMALADAVGWFQSAARARRVTVDDVDAAPQPSTSARSQSSRFLNEGK